MTKRVPPANEASKEPPRTADDYQREAHELLERAERARIEHALRRDAMVFLPANLAPMLRDDSKPAGTKTENALAHIALTLSDLARLMADGAQGEGEELLLRVVDSLDPKRETSAWCAIMYRAGVEAARGVCAHGFGVVPACAAVAETARERLRMEHPRFAEQFAAAIELEASGAAASANERGKRVASVEWNTRIAPTSAEDGFRAIKRLEVYYAKRIEYRALVWGSEALLALREPNREGA